MNKREKRENLLGYIKKRIDFILVIMKYQDRKKATLFVYLFLSLFLLGALNS